MFKDTNMLNATFKGNFGSYRLIGKLGGGGMATVYTGQNLSTNKQVVIKLFKPVISGSDEGIKISDLFAREVTILKESDHPNMVKYIDDFDDEYEDGKKGTRKVSFLVMEYIDGGDLDEIILPAKEKNVMDWLITICDVLDYNHQNEIYHGDIRPRNIMKDVNEKIYIIDYGGVKKNDPMDYNDLLPSPFFSSPEQLKVETIDNRTDIYSVGCTAYWLLTGKYYFDGVKKNDSRCNRIPTDLMSTDPNISSINPYLNSVITTALKEDKEKRFKHILDLKLKLESIQDPSIIERPNGIARLINNHTGEEFLMKRVVAQMGRKNLKCYNDVQIEDLTIDPNFNEGKGKNDMYISKQHARIVLKNMKYFVQDTYSKNGTYLNGVKLVGNKMKELNSGDNIKLGPLNLKNTANFTFKIEN